MKKIIITIPKEGGKWKVSFGMGFPILRKDLEPILVRIEKRLLASQLRDKTAVIIKDGRLVGSPIHQKILNIYAGCCLLFWKIIFQKDIIYQKRKNM